MAVIQKQVRMVFDLNKCLGCHTCTMACKTMWTDGRVDLPPPDPNDPGKPGIDPLENGRGLLYQYWNNVESMPGRGYPRDVFTPRLAGGFGRFVNGTFVPGPPPTVVNLDGELPTVEGDYGAPWEYNYDEVLMTSGGTASGLELVPSPAPDGANAYASNWDEDVGAGTYPNSYYFYLPRICNHCTRPACALACTRKAPYKREEDGIVLIDQDRCEGYRHCIQGCPYKKAYYNTAKKRSQKCIFCYPRAEQLPGSYDPAGLQPPRVSFCFNQCVGRIRFVGYFNPNIQVMDDVNQAKNVNKLIDKWKVALRLHPEFGTEPNLFYVPPLSPPRLLKGADSPVVKGSQRIPIDVLAGMFGDDATQTKAQRVARIQEIFTTLEAERAKVAAGGQSELVDILVAHDEADRIQLHLG